VEIYKKRGRWSVRNAHGRLEAKFATEKEAQDYAKERTGWVPPVAETLNGSTKEEESSKEEARTDEQEPVLGSKKSSKKKI
tara:strand:+ start:95 stop:337 length:243 start_codon:yes stop_codon:yes gene_type:complete